MTNYDVITHLKFALRQIIPHFASWFSQTDHLLRKIPYIYAAFCPFRRRLHIWGKLSVSPWSKESFTWRYLDDSSWLENWLLYAPRQFLFVTSHSNLLLFHRLKSLVHYSAGDYSWPAGRPCLAGAQERISIYSISESESTQKWNLVEKVLLSKYMAFDKRNSSR